MENKAEIIGGKSGAVVRKSGVSERKGKKKLPRRTCTWYPEFCDAAWCDAVLHRCRGYKEEETW